MIGTHRAMMASRAKAVAVAAGLFLLLAISAQGTRAEAQNTDGLAAYRSHLSDLQNVVTDCQKQRTSQACDASRVGADEKVQLAIGGKTTERTIRYDWLRALLARAAGKEETRATPLDAVPAANHAKPSVDALLTAAQKRLALDAQQVDGEAATPTSYEAARKTLSAILARREYQTVNKRSLRERFLDWLSNWINRILGQLAGLGMRAPWIPLVLRIVFITGACLALVWLLIRIERRSRIRLIADVAAIPGSPSSREWQLWLNDAREMAARGAWREAIHFLYWAVISRLESRRVWAPDRARTPREYLRMVHDDDARKEPLRVLTRSFERTWYGGRPAEPNDYESAVQVAEELGVK